jgi:hypothetical protein
MNRRPEQARCDVCYRSRASSVAALARHGRRGSNADRRALAAKAVAHAAYEHCNVRALASAIGVEFVENDIVEPMRIIHDGAVKLVLSRHQ